MKFQELLIAAIQRAEIPLRFEPGAEEAVASPVTEMLQSWITAHLPANSDSGFAAGDDGGRAGARALVVRLLAELDGSSDLPE